MADGRFQGRVAIVTGAGSGIGRAIARRFAREGAAVVVAEVNAATGEEVAAEIRAAGGQALSVVTDVADEVSVRTLVYTVEAEWGALHFLINNAGIDMPKPLDEMTVEVFDRVIDVDLRAMYLTARHATPLMERSGGGSIVNISSVMAWYTHPGYLAYTAAKAGVIGLTRTLALELGPRRIRANAICPGFVDTPMWERALARMSPEEASSYAERIRALHPVGRRGSPEDIAAAAAFLCSEDAEFINGVALVVDGGLTLKLVGW